MDKYLVCIDLDATFLKDDKTISDYSKKFVKEFVDKGNYFIINTGRPHQGTIQFLKELNIHQPIIVNNGSAIVEYDSNYEKVSSYHTFDMKIETIKNFYKEIESYIKTITVTSIFDFYSNDISSCPFFVLHPSEQITFHEGKIDEILKTIPLRSECFIKGEYIEQFLKVLNKIEYQKEFEFINWGEWDNIYSIEIFPKKASKGKAMEFLANKLGVKHHNTFAFGDQLNDLSMIEYAYDGVAILNARDEVKAKAKHITKKDNNNDGVVSYLEELIIL